jgi:hypothetical protein
MHPKLVIRYTLYSCIHVTLLHVTRYIHTTYMYCWLVVRTVSSSGDSLALSSNKVLCNGAVASDPFNGAFSGVLFNGVVSDDPFNGAPSLGEGETNDGADARCQVGVEVKGQAF